MDTKFENANGKGTVLYGLHFYPGLAQYQEDGNEPYRVFLNENTLRKMDPTFAGRPIFVEHVDDVDPNIKKLRSVAAGWVVESFYNSADGMHWVKMIIVSDEAERAIKLGYRLSNAYLPKAMKDGGGHWNGIPYQKEIIDGEYEHLAIVKNPRYEESIILTPDEFKLYNENKLLELKKISNSKEKGNKMVFSFFKKTKVENPFDSDIQVTLPASGKTVLLSTLLNEADKKANEYKSDEDPAMDKQAHSMADMDHMVKMHDGSYMKVKDMMNKYKAMNDDMEDMKKKKDSKELDVKPKEEEVKSESVKAEKDNAPAEDHDKEVAEVEAKEVKKDDMEENPESAVHDDKESDLKLKEEDEKEVKEAKKKNALEKATRLKNAHLKAFENDAQPQVIEISDDKVQRGVARYGSNK